MTGNGSRYAGNPFSPLSVAITTDTVSEDPTIETAAVRRAESLLKEYLGASALAGAGNVLAVSGEHGTGKTHLGMRLVRVAKAADPPANAMYLDVASDRFTGLYSRFIRKLGRDGVRARVNDFYADVVADSLATGTTMDIATLVRNREVAPDKVVGGYQMMESALLRQVAESLNEELGTITEDPAYGIALTLLLRPGYDDAVWDWLNGSAPHAALVERGITNRIDDEVSALDAMGVFALLHGRKGRRFVLVIDEIDKILTGRPIEMAVSKALQRLLQVFQQAGAFLVLSGLPEFRRALDEDVRERLGETVTMPPLSAVDVIAFIDRAQQGEPDLPDVEFQPAAVERMVRLVNGNPRQIFNLCHALYRTAVEESRPVDTVMVEDEVRGQASDVTLAEVSAAVRDLLNRARIPYFPGLHFGTRNSRADFWIETGRDSGFAIIVVDSVFTGGLEGLRSRLDAVRTARRAVEVVLVVANVLDPDAAAELTTHVVDRPVLYDRRSFAEALQPILRSLAERFTNLGGTNALPAIREWLVRIDMDNSTTHQMMERLGREIDRLTEDTAVQLATLRDRVNVVNLTAPADPAEESGRGFPASVAQLFHDALATLDRFGHPDALFDRVYTRAEDSSDHYRRVTQLLNRLAATGVYEAAGTLSMLRRWIVAFSTAAASWYVTEGRDAREAGPARSRFDALCRTYERVAETMPISRMTPLFRLVAEGELEGTGGRVADRTIQERVTEFTEQFRALGVQVRRTVLAELSSP
ncbi:hypothetical protein [Actinophytocola sp.]|uniref:hypothetical protein n=1 Tax=Actinophytocola sp. TaxID=1872138 RepID=UPI002ED40D7F